MPLEEGDIAPPTNLTALPLEQLSLTSRFGEGLANAPASLINSMMRLGFNLGIQDKGQDRPREVSKAYDIPEATNWKETITDIGADLIPSLIPFVGGEKLALKAADVLDASPAITRMMRVGGGFAASGLTESPEQAGIQGGIGAGMGVVENMLPRPAKVAAAGILGLVSGLEAKREGASNTQATIMGSVNALLPMITGRRAPVAALERAAEKFEPSVRPPQPPEGSLIRHPLMGEEEARNLGTLAAGGLPSDILNPRIAPRELPPPIKPSFELEGDQLDLPFRRSNGSVDSPRATGGQAMMGFMREGQLIEEPIFSPSEARRAAGVEPPPGSLIREPTYTADEIAKGKTLSGEEALTKIATLQPGEIAPPTVAPPAPKPKLPAVRLSSVLSHENEELAKAAAEKLGLEYHGIQGQGTPHAYFELKVPEGNGTPAAGGNVNIKVGSTYRELKDHVAFKQEQFTAKNGAELQAINEKWEARRSQREKTRIARETTPPAAPKEPEPVATLQSKEPTPGTIQSIEKIGHEADRQAAIKAVAAGTKPVTFVTGADKGFVKEAKAEGLKISRFKNKDGTITTAAHANNPAAVKALKDAHLSELPNAERNAAMGKALGFSDEEISAFQKRIEVATSQSAAADIPLPSPFENALPHGLNVGDKAVGIVDGERLTGTVHVGVEPDTVRFVEKNGTEHDLPPSRIAPLGGKMLPSRTDIKSVGGLQDVEETVEGAKREGGKLSLGGGGAMKRSNFGEHGSIDPAILSIIARYAAAPAVGAAVGYAEDDQHRLGSAIAGAVIGGLAATMGAKVFRRLAEGHPEFKTPGTTAEKLSRLGAAAKDDAVEFAKALVGDETKAARAASRWNLLPNFDETALWIERNVKRSVAATRFMDKARGLIQDHSEIMRDSIKNLSRVEGIAQHHEDLTRYFEGKLSHTELMSKVPEVVSSLAASAMQARTALQKIVAEGLGAGKLSTTISDSIGSYLTTSYKIFHDAKYIPTDSQIEAAARSMSAEWGTFETKLDKLHEYLHEIKADKGLYGSGSGQMSLSSILARKGDLSPAFRAMLGEYDNPLERMAHTAIKLVNAAKSAEFFNEVARGVKENGLRYSYTTAEREATIATLQSTARLGHSIVEREAAAAKLADLKQYTWNAEGPSSGRLSHSFMDRRMRDQLANYSRDIKASSGPLMRSIMETTNAIKYGQTVGSPLQLVRQVYQMPILGLMSKTTPLDWIKSIKTIFDKSEAGQTELTRLKRLGVYGGDPVGGMLREDMKYLMDGSLDRILGERVSGALHKWEEAWRTPDLVIRVAAFQRAEARLAEQFGAGTKATDAAIDHMNRYTMNYGAVPPIVKYGRQLPFVNQYLSFTFEAMRITKNLIQDAAKGDVYAMGVLATVGAAPFIIQQMSESQLSEKDNKEWQQVKALGRPYERHNFRFVQERMPNGDFRYISFSPLVLHDPLLQSFRAVMSGHAGDLLDTNPFVEWNNTPLLNVVSSLVTHRNRTTGQALYGFGDYAQSIRADVAPILLGTDLDRLERALRPNEEGGRGVIDIRSGKVSSVEDIIQTYATSMRPYTVRPAYLLRQAQAAAIDQIKASQNHYKSVLATNASAEVKGNAKADFDIAIQHIMASFKENYGVSLTSEE